MAKAGAAGPLAMALGLFFLDLLSVSFNWPT